MKKLRLLIADDHSVVRDGIRMVLESFPNCKIVGEAEDGNRAVELARHLKPDIILMDISMPHLNGIEATAIVKEQNPDIKVVILTVHEEEEYIHQILRAGASGYVLKSSGRKEIFAAVKSAISGERFFSPGVSRIITESFIKREKDRESVSEEATQTGRALTKREVQVLKFIAQGHTNRRIAEALFLSIRTVNTHRTNLMKKLDIHDTAGLVRHAIETKLVKLNNEGASASYRS